MVEFQSVSDLNSVMHVIIHFVFNPLISMIIKHYNLIVHRKSINVIPNITLQHL